LNRSGPRVDCRKLQGFFSKRGGANRYARSSAAGLGSGGSDLKDPRSNRSRKLRIGRRRGVGADGGGAGRRDRACAAALRRTWSKSAIRGQIGRGFGSGRISASPVIHSRHQLGSGRLSMSSAAAVAEWHGEGSSERSVQSDWGWKRRPKSARARAE
jgi:hypothetical protein